MSDAPTNLKPGGQTFDLNDAKAAASGLVMRLPFPDAKKSETLNQAELFKLPTSSVLGTPRYFAINIGGVELPNEPMIRVSGAKNIVVTDIAGGDDAVVEMIGRQRWKIQIQGWAIREGATRDRPAGGLVPDDFPEEWLRKLVTLYNRNEALDCQCQLLTYFNISRLVIEDIDFPPMTGAGGKFAYQINASSDRSALAKLKQLRRK
jgi:hypothetical protein